MLAATATFCRWKRRSRKSLKENKELNDDPGRRVAGGRGGALTHIGSREEKKEEEEEELKGLFPLQQKEIGGPFGKISQMHTIFSLSFLPSFFLPLTDECSMTRERRFLPSGPGEGGEGAEQKFLPTHTLGMGRDGGREEW